MEATATPMRLIARRLGSKLLLLGAVTWILLSGLHGALPGTGHDDVRQALHPLWRLIHIITIVAVAMVAAGLSLIGSALAAPRATVLGRTGTAFIVPAGAVLGVGFAIDGFVLAHLAEAYRSAPDQTTRDMVVMQADLVSHVISATSFAFQTLFGIAVTAMAFAMMVSSEYPVLLCRLGLLGGAGWTLAGLLLFSQVPGIGSWAVLIPAIPAAVWMLGVGWIGWRHEGQSSPNKPGTQPLPSSPPGIAT